MTWRPSDAKKRQQRAEARAEALNPGLSLPYRPRETDEVYLDWLRQQPCCIGRMCDGPTEPSHIKTRGAGGGDEKAVPHCAKHHRLFHSMGRQTFDAQYGDQLFLAAVYRARYERGMRCE